MSVVETQDFLLGFGYIRLIDLLTCFSIVTTVWWVGTGLIGHDSSTVSTGVEYVIDL